MFLIKKTVALFIWKHTHRQTDEDSCYTQLLLHTFFLFLTRKNKLKHRHLPWLKGSTLRLGEESWAYAITCQWKTTTFTPRSCSLVLQNLNTISKKKFTPVQLNPDQLALPTKACTSITPWITLMYNGSAYFQCSAVHKLTGPNNMNK